MRSRHIPAARDARVLVIGAGPAGASAAAAVARALGADSTLLVERSAWPRAKVCGCCLGKAGVSLIERHGLVADIRKLGGVPLREIEIRCRGAAAHVRHTGGLALARASLDAALVAGAIELGARFEPETSASVLRREGDGWIVRLTHRLGLVREERFGLVLVADGIGGLSLDGFEEMGTRISRSAWMGMSAVVGTELITPRALGEPGVVRMHVGRGGYVGTVRLDERRAAVAGALDPHEVRKNGGPAQLMERIAASCGNGLAQTRGSERIRFTGTALLTRRRDRIALPGLLVVGDSAGYVEPFTGEGMTWAIASGVRAAQLGAEGLQTGAMEELASAWTAEHARIVGRRQRTCRGFRAFVRRPLLVEGAVHAISRFELASRCAELVARTMGVEYLDGTASETRGAGVPA